MPQRLLPLLVFLLFATAAGAQERYPLTTGYELFYRGDLGGAYRHFRELERENPEALAPSYGVLSVLYVRDLREKALADEFEERAQRVLERAERRYERDEHDLEALFYLAQAHGLRAGYRFQHDKGLWGAVRDAVKAKRYSETYVQLDPGRADAYLALGLYNYYAELAPSFVRFLRVLLFIPGGDRRKGLEQLEHAARHGEMWAPQAQLELIQIYGWLEGRLDEALALAEGLRRRYPYNADLNFRLASLYAGPVLEAYERAAEEYSLILERTQAGHPHYDQAAGYEARLGLAEAWARQWRLLEAISLLDPVVEREPTEPAWALPRSLLARGRFRALLDDPEASADARRVLAEPGWKETWHAEARRQLRWIEERRKSGEAAREAELIPGNRLVAEERWELAEKFYARVLRRQLDNWLARYRMARLHLLQGKLERARQAFREIVEKKPRLSEPLMASVWLSLARVHDLQSDREQAVTLYKKVVDDYGDEEDSALAARLGLVAPYRRAFLDPEAVARTD